VELDKLRNHDEIYLNMENHSEVLPNPKETTKPLEEMGGGGGLRKQAKKNISKRKLKTTKNIPVIVNGEVTTTGNSKLISDIISSCHSNKINKDTNLTANSLNNKELNTIIILGDSYIRGCAKKK
jgi:hypothetical protein